MNSIRIGTTADLTGIRTCLRPRCERGIDVQDGTAERLPYGDNQFDVVVLVTTICFVDDLGAEEPVRDGYGDGAFVAIRGRKQTDEPASSSGSDQS